MKNPFKVFEEPVKPRRILDQGIDVLYEPGFLSGVEATAAFENILKGADWHRPKMTFGDRVHETRRQVAWHADKGLTYSYSGQRHRWVGWTPALQKIREKVEDRMGMKFNGVLLNHYADGSEYVSPHADDETDMEDGIPIVAVSLGAARDFVVAHTESKNRHVLSVENGSLLIMAGDTQKVSKHSIPKRASVMKPRISLTFRRAIPKGIS